jgi:anti-sigma-K factor RskA
MTGPHDDARDETMVAWVLGELPAGERDAFARRLASDPDLARQVAELEEALATFGTAEPVAPSPALRDRVLAVADLPVRVPPTAATRPPASPPLLTRVAPWLGLAAAAAIVLAVKFQGDVRELRAARDGALVEVKTLAAALEARDSLLARLTDPSTELITLAATGAPTPRVKLQLDRRRQLALLSVASLDAAPDGQTYQLWYIVDGTPVPSTTFLPSADGTALVASIPLPDSGGVQAVAVTLEPAGGSQTPTMPILFLGAVATE